MFSFFGLLAIEPVGAQPNNGVGGGGTPPSNGGVGGSGTGNNNGVNLGTYGPVGIEVDFDNPLDDDIADIEDLVQILLNVLIIIATPIIVIFIVLAGFKYVTAQGDPSKLEEAKRALVYAIIGGVLVVGAVAIFEIIVGTIDAFRNNP